jgi:hypothetical protein
MAALGGVRQEGGMQHFREIGPGVLSPPPSI